MTTLTSPPAVAALVASLLLPAVGATPPGATASSPCFRSDAFDRARERFAQQSQKGDWETAMADARAAASRPASDAVTRALYALQHAQAAQQRSAYSRADPEGVLKLLQAAEEPVRAAKDACLASDLQFQLAQLHYWQGFETTVAWDQVRQEVDAVLRSLEPLQDEGRQTLALFYRGLVDQQQEVGDRGQRYFERARDMAIRRGDDYRLSYLERHLAAIDDERGDLAAAEARFRRSLALREKVGALLFIPPAQWALADLLQRKDPGNPEIMRLYTDAAARAVAAKAHRIAASVHEAMARRLASAGDRTGALQHAGQAFTFAQAYGSSSLVSATREALEQLKAAK